MTDQRIFILYFKYLIYGQGEKREREKDRDKEREQTTGLI